jgi:hypothetical protein
MENETTKNRQLKSAFMLDPTSLRTLQTILSEIHGPVEYRVKFSDGSTVRYADIEEIVSQPNSGGRSIVSVISSVSGEGRTAFLGMRGDPEPSVEYTLTGRQRDVIYFADKLDDWLASCTQWYSRFYTSNLGLLLAVAVIALPVYFAGRVAKVYPPGKGDWHQWLPGLTLVAVSVAEYWTLRLFPRATFAVGYGARRNQLFGVIRVSVLLATVVALVREWVMRHL